MTSKISVRALYLSAAAAAFLTGAGPAAAASTTQPLTGTALETIAIVGAPATFTTNFQAGSTATTAGVLTATDTNNSWSLTVSDAATGTPGHMVAATLGCSGSEAKLQNPLSVSVTSPLSGVTSAGAVSISGSPQTVASATSQPLAASILTTNYSQTINSGETLLTGCVYSLTATYTLQ
ncbi:MAG TPA: hypothetical protein VHU13_08970 [Solirubrobacteraceae bacterium]|jgi:hypothetical protein|nr:hypothetical protein [Solirubrobacteraceae bacterium]